MEDSGLPKINVPRGTLVIVTEKNSKNYDYVIVNCADGNKYKYSENIESILRDTTAPGIYLELKGEKIRFTPSVFSSDEGYNIWPENNYYELEDPIGNFLNKYRGF